MAQTSKDYRPFEQTSLQLQLQYLAAPETAAYVAELKRKYQKYAMPADEARKIVDASMGEKTLTELLYEARKQVG